MLKVETSIGKLHITWQYDNKMAPIVTNCVIKNTDTNEEFVGTVKRYYTDKCDKRIARKHATKAALNVVKDKYPTRDVFKPISHLVRLAVRTNA
jgi:hypothetical protein